MTEKLCTRQFLTMKYRKLTTSVIPANEGIHKNYNTWMPDQVGHDDHYEKLYTLSEKFSQLVKQFPDKIVMQIKTSNGYKKYSYKDLYQISQSVAYSLQELGIKKGDKLAIVLENRPEWGAIYFAIMFVGGIAVPLDPQSNQEDIQYFLHNSESKIVFTSQQFLSLLPKSSILKIIILDDKMFSATSPVTVLTKIIPENTASILYTSGTTGKPKGVMLTHKNFYANFRSINKLKIIGKEDNLLSILPLHHSFPFMVTLIIPLFTHGTITYVPSLKSEEILTCMRETGVTMLVGVPQLFYLFYKNIANDINKIPWLLRVPLSGSIELTYLLRKISKINLTKFLLARIHRVFGKNLRFFVCGGAKLDVEIIKFLNKIGFIILEGYGLTETAPVVTFNPYKKQKTGSVGKPIPNVKVKIINPDEHGVGEVAISGPNVMQGYYKLKKETQAVLKNNWFYSGDLGYLDKQDYLYLTGRKSELIVLSSGKNITPEEVESYYAKSSFIKELCVLAISDREQEKLMAVIVPDLDHFRKRGEVNIYKAIKWDLENLSKNYPIYKRIMGFIIAKQDLPRTRLGKLKRFAIEANYKNELLGIKPEKIEKEAILSDEDLQILASKTGKEIIKILTEEKEIKLDDNLEMDLGFDSLGRVELAASLEKLFNIKISESIMTQIFTVRELISNVEQLLKKGKKKLAVEPQIFSWGDILKTDPSQDILAKITLYPNWWHKTCAGLISGISKFLFKTLWRLKTIGTQNLSSNKTFILCANHNSYMDGFLIASAVPSWLRKQLYFLGIRGIFKLPIIRNIIKILKIIPIDPGAYLIDAMQASAYVLRNNKMVCIFPEGVRSIDGEIKSFKKGIGILAKELNIDLVPAYIGGSFEAWPRGQRFPKPHPITIIFGEAQNVAKLKKIGIKLGAKDDYEAIALGIREKIKELKAYY